MQPRSSDPLTVATLNTLGIRIVQSRLPSRYKLIAEGLEKGDADVVCLQEIATYWHLWLLARAMPSFRYVSYSRATLGPAGALVTFSRLPVAMRAKAGNVTDRTARGNRFSPVSGRLAR